VSLARYLLGLALLAAYVAPVAFAAVRLRRRLVPGWWGAPARLVEVVLALTGWVVVAQLLGSVGLFRPLPLAAACLAVGAVGSRIRSSVAVDGADRREEEAEGPPRPAAWTVALAIGATALVAAQWASRAAPSVFGGVQEYDSLHYHLPFAAHYAREGWLTGLHPTTPGWPTMFHPANTEVLHAYGLHAFGRDMLSALLNLAWGGIALLAAWCAGRPWGRDPLAVTGVAMLVALPLVVVTQPGSATNDVAVVALVLAAIAVVVQPGRSLPAWGVAGLATGLGVGSKLTMLVPAAALTVAVIVAARAAERRRVVLVWAGALVLPGAYWYLRNLAHAGNPLPTVPLGIGPLRLPTVHFELLEDFGFSVAHYATDVDIWRSAFAPALDRSFGPGWPLVLLLAAAGALVALGRRHDRRVRLLAAVPIVGTLGYLVTPGTALGYEGHPNFFFAVNLRYLTPALAPALVLLAIAVRRQWLAGAGFAAALLAAQTSRDFPAWADHRRGAIAVGLLVAAAGVLLARGVTRARAPVPAPALRRLAAAGALAAVLAAVPAGYAFTGRFLDSRYRHHPAWDWARSLTGRHIAILGFDRQYPLWGTALENDVEYVGRRGPRGGFDRYTRCEDLRAALRAERYDAIVFVPELTYGEDRKGEWVRLDPGVTEIARAGDIGVYEFDWRTPVGQCPG
jgi:hypothetical protein